MPRHRKNPPSLALQPQSPQELVATLQQQIARLETGRRPEAATVSSGCPPLDNLLPEKGLRRGTLVEWLSEGEGTGATTLALLAARQACASGGMLVVMDFHRQFYPPAAARPGVRLEPMVVVQAANVADNLWALDQALRCPAVMAVLGWPEKLDGRTFRRLQLAAEQGGGLGLLVRPTRARHEPSWAEIRLLIEPLPALVNQRNGAARAQGTAVLSGAELPAPPRAAVPPGRRLRIVLLRSRGQACGESVEVEVDDETCAVRLAAQLAHSATHPRASGA